MYINRESDNWTVFAAAALQSLISVGVGPFEKIAEAAADQADAMVIEVGRRCAEPQEEVEF